MLNFYRQASRVPPRSRPSRHGLEASTLWVDHRATADLDRRSTLAAKRCQAGNGAAPQPAGFDVVGARDLDQDTLRRSFRDFLDKAEASGPNTVAFMYLSGYGLQLEGENYYVPIDARTARESDIAAQAVRVSDYTRPLAALNLQASIVVLDIARPHPFVRSGGPLAGGLALVERPTSAS